MKISEIILEQEIFDRGEEEPLGPTPAELAAFEASIPRKFFESIEQKQTDFTKMLVQLVDSLMVNDSNVLARPMPENFAATPVGVKVALETILKLKEMPGEVTSAFEECLASTKVDMRSDLSSSDASLVENASLNVSVLSMPLKRQISRYFQRNADRYENLATIWFTQGEANSNPGIAASFAKDAQAAGFTPEVEAEVEMGEHPVITPGMQRPGLVGESRRKIKRR